MTFLSENERKKTGLLICDCSEFHRLGEIDGDLKNLDTFIIDHHKTADCPENAECIIALDAPCKHPRVICADICLSFQPGQGTVPFGAMFFQVFVQRTFHKSGFKYYNKIRQLVFPVANILQAMSRICEAVTSSICRLVSADEETCP